jgi:hypothetical protein
VNELESGRYDWILLLQLDSDDDAGMMWGDVGMLYFWIKREDLKKENFDNVWMILQCVSSVFKGSQFQRNRWEPFFGRADIFMPRRTREAQYSSALLLPADFSSLSYLPTPSIGTAVIE